MERIAIFQGDKVVNIAIYDVAPEGAIPIGNAGIGWTWDGVSFHPPVETAQDIERAKDEAIKTIKSERDRRKFNGVYVASVSKWFHTDTYSRTQWLGMAMLGASLPTIVWKTMDGSLVAVTPSVVQAVFAGTLQLDSTLFAHAESLITQVNACATVLEVASINLATGWAATYEP